MRGFLLTVLILIAFTAAAQQPKLVLPVGHSGTADEINITTNKRYLCSSDRKGLILFWDIRSGKQLYSIQATPYRLFKTLITKDDKFIITIVQDASGADALLKMWNIQTGGLVKKMNLWDRKSEGALLIENDNILVKFSQSVGVVNLKKWEINYTIEGENDLMRVECIGNKFILLQDKKEGISIYDLLTGKKRKSFTDDYVYDFAINQEEIALLFKDSIAIAGLPGFGFHYSIPVLRDSISALHSSQRAQIFYVEMRNGRVDCLDADKKNTRTVFSSFRYTGMQVSGKQDLLLYAENDSLFSLFNMAENRKEKDISTGSKITGIEILQSLGIAFVYLKDTSALLVNLSNPLIPIKISYFNSSSVDHLVVYPPDCDFFVASRLHVVDIRNGQIRSSLESIGTENNLAVPFLNVNRLLTTGYTTGLIGWDMSIMKPVYFTYFDLTRDNILYQSTALTGYSEEEVSNDDLFVFDIKKGEKIKSVKTGLGLFKSQKSKNAGKYSFIVSNDSVASIWNASELKLIYEIKASEISPDLWPVDAEMIDCSEDCLKLCLADKNKLRVIDLRTGKIILDLAFPEDQEDIEIIKFSPDNNTIITGGHNGMLRFVDIRNGKTVAANEHHYGISSVGFSKSGGQIVSGSNNGELIFWDNSGKMIRKIIAHNELISSISFSNDYRYILTASWDNSCKIWDAKSGKQRSILRGHTNMINSAVFSEYGNLIFTTSKDKTTKCWRAADGKLLYTIVQTGMEDYLVLLPSGYYLSTPPAQKLVNYSKGLHVIGFEQLDVKYNRPDKVLEAIGNTDTALIKSYRKAWEKRIKKLGIDTTAFRDGYSVPECDFVNRDNIEYEQKTETLSLRLKGMDRTYQLDRFNIWVNEAPVFGQRGISIRRRNRNSLDTTITIKLSQGENRIETSITNVNGTESYRMPLVVNYTPVVRQKESLRFIGIGIDRFADPKNNLQYSCKDIRDLSVKLKEKYKEAIIIDTLFNENVTISNVKGLKQKLLETSVNDKVIISYSGHGLLSIDYDYFLSTYSINFDKPDENGLPYDELENLLDSIPARKKLMLIDACHSGEVDKDEVTHYKAAEDSLMKQGTKGGKLRYTGKTQVGMKNSFELMQSLFVNVGKSTGATIISAAAGTQFALERGDLKNGVFTYSILEAMDNNPTMKISALKKTVGERVEQLTNGLQKPTSRNETIAVDWSLW